MSRLMLCATDIRPTFASSSRAVYLRLTSQRFAPSSALILLVHCPAITREIRFRWSSGSITKDRRLSAVSYELLAFSSWLLALGLNHFSWELECDGLLVSDY